MSENMTIKLVKRTVLRASVERWGNRVIFSRQASQDVGGGFSESSGLANRREKVSKSFGFLEIVVNGEVAFLECGQIITCQKNNTSVRLGAEHVLQSNPYVTRGHETNQIVFGNSKD